ncbi:Thioredoxin [uncultured archaeon]|nr:Thioredoxin [uncultured archaeon]
MGDPKRIELHGGQAQKEEQKNARKERPMEKIGESLIVNYNGNEAAVSNLINSKKIVILKFSSAWCGPCLEQERNLKKMAKNNDASLKDILVVDIDIDFHPTQGYKIHSQGNPIGMRYNLFRGKSGLGCVLFVDGKKKEWAQYPYEEDGLKVVGLGTSEEELRRMLNNVRKKVGK